MGHAAPAGGVRVALSTTSVFPERTPDAFELAARLGYDGVEVMVTTDPVSQDADVLQRLSDYHGIPVLAVHAPGLLITQWVWGREPWEKLARAGQAAEQLGAGVVVVHPPFRWQRDYVRDFEAGLASIEDRSHVAFAVENLYPLRARGTEVAAYAPHWNPVELDCRHATLDLSHTAVSGSDALQVASELGSRLAHVHLADGTKPGLPDEHLVPGRGTQPCAELLQRLGATSFTGTVVLEVKTFRAADQREREADLAESLDFARRHLAIGAQAAGGAAGEHGTSGGALAGTSSAGSDDAGSVTAGGTTAGNGSAGSRGRADGSQDEGSQGSAPATGTVSGPSRATSRG